MDKNEFEHKASLKDYSNEELLKFLENNDLISLKDLAGICSEVLKRILIKKTLKIDKD